MSGREAALPVAAAYRAGAKSWVRSALVYSIPSRSVASTWTASGTRRSEVT